MPECRAIGRGIQQGFPERYHPPSVGQAAPMERMNEPDAHPAAVAAVLEVMARHMDALNRENAAALTATLHFPHYRFTGGRMKIWKAPERYLADIRARAGDGWHHSAWDFLTPVAAGGRQGAPRRSVHPLSRRWVRHGIIPVAVGDCAPRRCLGRAGAIELRGIEPAKVRRCIECPGQPHGAQPIPGAHHEHT